MIGNIVARINSRTKGKNGELELAKFLRDRGHTARRGVQFKGGVDSPDVVCETLPGFHLECKRVEKCNLYPWLEQAIRDGKDKVPVVVHRRSRQEWVAILRLEDFLKLYGNRSFQTVSPEPEGSSSEAFVVYPE